MRQKVLCYGYYGANANNLGDSLFKVAFSRLFSDVDFTFTDTIRADEDLTVFSAFFFGAGSFLDGKINASDAAIDFVKNKPIFYLGVGGETNISWSHKRLMEQAKLIAIRNDDVGVLANKVANKNIISIPDLVYSLQPDTIKTEQQNKILFIPNFLVVPKHNDPYWKISAWERAKFSIAEALDKICSEYVRGIDCFSMSTNPQANDANAMVEIANLMEFGHNIRYFTPTNFDDDMKLISSYKAVITQRYHGIILSELCKTQHIVLSHHDKLKSHSPKQGEYVDYYAISKHKIVEAFETIWNNPRSIQSINLHSFDDLVGRVNQSLRE